LTNDEREFFSDLSDWTPASAPPVNEYSRAMAEYAADLPEVDFTKLEAEPVSHPGYHNAELEYFDEIPSPFEHDEIDLEIDGDLWDKWDDLYEDIEDTEVDETYKGGK
jgi:hypothetical protein